MVLATPSSTALKLGSPELNAQLSEILLVFFAAVFIFYEIAPWGTDQILWGLNALLNLDDVRNKLT